MSQPNVYREKIFDHLNIGPTVMALAFTAAIASGIRNDARKEEIQQEMVKLADGSPVAPECAAVMKECKLGANQACDPADPNAKKEDCGAKFTECQNKNAPKKESRPVPTAPTDSHRVVLNG